MDGNASLTRGRSKGTDERQTVITVSPSVLYFVHPGIAVGASAVFGHHSGGGASSWTYSLGPQAVVYFGEENASVRPFVRADAGIGRTKSTGTGPFGPTTQRASLSHVGAGAWNDQFGVAFGFSMFLGD